MKGSGEFEMNKGARTCPCNKDSRRKCLSFLFSDSSGLTALLLLLIIHKQTYIIHKQTYIPYITLKDPSNISRTEYHSNLLTLAAKHLILCFNKTLSFYNSCPVEVIYGVCI